MPVFPRSHTIPAMPSSASISDGPSVDGLLLMGGQSTRFLPDKMQESLAGSPLFHHVFRRLAGHCDRIWLSTARAGTPPLVPDGVRIPWQVIPDSRSGLGPLGGLYSVLDHLASRGGVDHVLVVAGDLPSVSDETLSKLLAAPAASVVCARDATSGQWQPLCARWSPALAPRLKAYLGSGRRSVMGFLDDLDTGTVDVPSADLVNINRPDDLDIGRG